MSLQNTFRRASTGFSGRSRAAIAGALAIMVGFGSLSVGGAITDTMVYGQPALEQVGQATVPRIAIDYVPGVRTLVDLGVKAHETGQHKVPLSAAVAGFAAAGTALASAGFALDGLALSGPERKYGRVEQMVRDYRAHRLRQQRAAHRTLMM